MVLIYFYLFIFFYFYFSDKIKRVSWSKEENDAFKHGFKRQLKNQEYASAQEMRKVKSQYPCLQRRSEYQIRAKFSNMYKKKRNENIY